MARHASCSCGQIRVACKGDPVRLSVCHCLECQKRTGSAFGVQARFPKDAVTIEGEASGWTRKGDSGGEATLRFCATCGSTVYWEGPDTVAVAVGCFADPTFPAPTVSVYDVRRHPWVGLPKSLDKE